MKWFGREIQGFKFHPEDKIHIGIILRFEAAAISGGIDWEEDGPGGERR